VVRDPFDSSPNLPEQIYNNRPANIDDKYEIALRIYITTIHTTNKPNFTKRYTTFSSTTFQSPQNQVRSTVDTVCHSLYNNSVQL